MGRTLILEFLRQPQLYSGHMPERYFEGQSVELFLCWGQIVCPAGQSQWESQRERKRERERSQLRNVKLSDVNEKTYATLLSSLGNHLREY